VLRRLTPAVADRLLLSYDVGSLFRLTNPDGSLVAGMLAKPKDRQMMSFKTCCLAILPGAFLHNIAWRPWASTWTPHE